MQRPHVPGSCWVGNKPLGRGRPSEAKAIQEIPLQQSFVNCHRTICNISDNSSSSHSSACMCNCLLETVSPQQLNNLVQHG